MHSLKSHPVPTFYDTDEVPQQLPVLSSQSEMYYLPKACVRVSAMEEMALLHLPMAISTTNAESHMSIARTSSRTTAPREEMPVLKPRGNVARKSVTIIEDHGESSSSPLSSESSLSSWDEDDSNGNRNRKKIPKPNGEVGRPGWGGYNLEDQLGWGKDSFKKLQQFIKKAVKKHLDTTKCRSLQDHKALETVNKMTVAQFPDLDDFEECWLVQDLVQLQLKYSSFKTRQQKWAMTTPPSSNISAITHEMC
ncbi:hypothetical protein EDD17DRAFT_1762461 [Pisolithus thermaeus]|nr:hypothetical protein EDD17DRAFT_1762461 [Pisolithus thermaeus]